MIQHKTKTIAYWRKLIDEFKQSDLTQTEFCRQRQLRFKTFNNWYRKLNITEPTQPDLIPLSVPEASISNHIEIKWGKRFHLILTC